jgi:hypothetical protein
MPLLNQAAIDQIKNDVTQALSAKAVTGIPFPDPNFICANKDLIMGFIKALVALIPGWIGKIVGEAIVAAAEAWFAKECKRN